LEIYFLESTAAFGFLDFLFLKYFFVYAIYFDDLTVRMLVSTYFDET
jgi:hypothetical protein